MGTISNDNKRILKNRLETAKEWLEGAIEEVDAITNEPCDVCYDPKTLSFSKQFVHTYLDSEPCNYCPMCGRDLKGEGK